MTKTVRTIEIKKAAEEMYGEKILEQIELLKSLKGELARLRGRVENLEGIQIIPKLNVGEFDANKNSKG